ncbi:MAG: alpha/beta hydrolase [Candidatus Nanopelagicales bacterium]
MTYDIGCAFLHRPDGRIAFDVAGAGPLIVLVPGMGDLRSTYRHVADELRRSGLRVATTDLRGHGDSDATFATYGDVATAEDVVALVEHLGGPAILVGNSMGAGAAAYAAADRPDLVAGLVLIGPFVRNGTVGAVKRALFRIAMAPWWAIPVWRAYLPSLYAGRRPDDLEAHLAAVGDSLRRPGHARAFVRTTRTSHAPVEARLDEVRVPVLVLMGTKDPDFPDPRLEAEWIAERVHGRAVMIDDAGHYPQSQQPQRVLAAMAEFLPAVLPRA